MRVVVSSETAEHNVRLRARPRSLASHTRPATTAWAPSKRLSRRKLPSGAASSRKPAAATSPSAAAGRALREAAPISAAAMALCSTASPSARTSPPS